VTVVLAGTEPVVLRRADGGRLPLPSHRWTRPATGADRRLLARAVGPVLDVGCGPGRHVTELAARGRLALGIDISVPALEMARRAGAPVLHRSVFDRIPGAGRWGTALLLDGNVGIGGDPVALLRRVASLLRPGGLLLVEMDETDGAGDCGAVRFETPSGAGPWFRWSTVGHQRAQPLAAEAGLALEELWADDGRRFARLDVP
jgi:SAM-dependent methyltransferase